MFTLEELYETYSGDIYRFAYWLSGNSSDAEDITSETFVRAWFKYDVDKTETLKAYLMTIARNIYLESLRKHREQISLEEGFPDLRNNMEKDVQLRSELREIQKIIQTMNEEDRTAFILRVEHNLPYAEIARVLKISETATKVKIHRVRKKLLQERIRTETHE